MMISKRNILKLILVVVVVGGYVGYNSMLDIFRAIERSKSGLTKESVLVGDHKIVYLEGGKGDVVILLHGFGDSKDAWVKFSRKLTGQFKVIIPDLPGFGESTKDINSSYRIETQVERIHEFAKALGIRKFHIAGNSMGGLISGMYAITYPDEVLSLGLFDNAGIKDREKSEFLKELEKGYNPLIVEKESDMEKMLNFMFYKAPAIPGVVMKQLAERAIASSEFNKKVMKDGIPMDMLEKRIGEIKAKTIVIWGDTDRIFPASSAYVIGKYVKNSKVYIIKECGHLPMTEKPEETSKYYFDFII